MGRAIETDFGFVWSGKIGWPYRLLRPRTRRQLGAWGEWLALRHVRRLGWSVVARNWRNRRGELDLIAYEDRQLVVVEVRTRRLSSFRLSPEATIDRKKETQMEDLAMDFMRRFEIPEPAVRFDVIAIDTTDCVDFELRHFTL